jgi:hypothetical protein
VLGSVASMAPARLTGAAHVPPVPAADGST